MCCGIVGVVSALGLQEAKARGDFLRQAIFCDTFRGKDSTGLFYVEKNSREVGFYKNKYNGAEFVDVPFVAKIFANMEDYSIAIGHNRWKTTGTIERRDAHPFQHKHITLVHNGTINNSFELPGFKFEEHKGAPQVDSYRLTVSVAEAGAEEAFANATGGYACVWWDARDNSLNFTRNNDKPLSIAFAKGNKTLCMASEWQMLSWLMDRNKLERGEKINIITPMVFHKVTFDGNAIKIVKTPYTKKKIERPANSHVGHHHPSYATNYDDDEDAAWYQDAVTSPIIALPAPAQPLENGLKFKTKYPEDRPNKKIKRLNVALRPLNLTYLSKIWSIPDIWKEYTSETGIGWAVFRHFRSGYKINVYDLPKREWEEALASGLLTALIITDVTYQARELVGTIDWSDQLKSWKAIELIEEGDNSISFIPLKPTDTLITRKAFGEMVKDGCAWCEAKISIYDSLDLQFIDNKPICKKCNAGVYT